MSTPTLAGGGRTITVGTTPVLLTEYGPIAAINISTARVWLAADSSVGPSTGVPLDPGTAYAWRQAGQVWAILDPAAAVSGASVVITGTSDRWSPSPATIAAQVSEQLLANGIPNVFNLNLIYSGTLAAVNTNTPTLDVHAYGSVVVAAISETGRVYVNVTFEGESGNPPYYFDTFGINYAGAYAVQTYPVSAAQLYVTNFTNNATQILVFGSNRVYSAPVVAANSSPLTYTYSGNLTAGTPQPLANYATEGLAIAGPCQCEFEIAGATGTILPPAGAFTYSVAGTPPAVDPLDYEIASTFDAGWHPQAAAAGAPAYALTKTVRFPRAQGLIYFTPIATIANATLKIVASPSA